jgi:signal transduction histidine kinase
MRWPIRYQILLPFAGVMLAAVFSVSLLNAYWAAVRTQRDIEEQLRGVARTLLASTFPLTPNVLDQMHGLTRAEFVLTSAAGHVLATSGPADLALPAAENVTDRWEDLRLGPIVTLGDSRYFHVALRADRRGGSDGPGFLHVLYPEGVLRDARRQAVVPPLAVGATALVLCVALASWIAGQISRPLVGVRTQVSRMAEGDFQPLAVPARNDEVRDVATSVNQLARQLDELRRAIARAERLSVLGRLSGGLAHHLRNGVAGALMAVQMHRRHCRTADQESLDVAERQLSLTEEHLKRFLAAGQPEQPRRTSFDLRELVDDLIALLTPMARHRRVGLSCSVPAEPIFLCADSDQLRQALMNLMLNAIEAVGKEGRVRVGAAVDGPMSIVRVLDTGPGLVPQMSQRLGEPFATTKPEGVGLGLAVALHVAEAHRGSLRYSRTGDMTCFELSIPVEAGEARGRNAAAAMPEPIAVNRNS